MIIFNNIKTYNFEDKDSNRIHIPRIYANDYKHLAGVKAFKEDYVAKFLETRNFHLVFKENFSDGKPGLEQNEDNRIAITMLKYKNG